MTIESATKILHSKRSSKAELRQALAYVLGVELPPEPTNVESLHTKCKQVFCELYKAKTGLDYMFVAKDAGALKQVLQKVEGILQVATDDNVILTFRALIEKLPDWYVQNAFSLPVINKKFNEIAASIKKNGSTTKQPVSESYKDRIRRSLRS